MTLVIARLGGIYALGSLDAYIVTCKTNGHIDAELKVLHSASVLFLEVVSNS